MSQSAVIAPDSPAALINRELSWLDFSRRVLALAQDTDQPLLERVKFAGSADDPGAVPGQPGRRAHRT